MTRYIPLSLLVAGFRCWAEGNLLSVLSVSLWLDISGFCDRSGWVTLSTAVKDVESTETGRELLKHETSSRLVS